MAEPLTDRPVVQLPTGRLSLRLDRCALPLEQLCGFAARNNPRRGFLFVSKVLGKHWPCTAATMRDAHQRLVARIHRDWLDSAVFIGMAETATGLGQGLFEAALRVCAAGRGPALYLQSTRYPIAGAQRLEFEEPHSHAAQQLLYVPEDPTLRAALLSARTVVLVDDEMSTGATLANLVTVLRQHNPQLQRVVLACLTDFSEGRAGQRVGAVDGIVAVDTVALLHGAFEFERDPRFHAEPAATAFAPMSCRRAHLGPSSARLGTANALQLSDELIANAVLHCRKNGLDQRPVLVLGTGEFMHPAFVLAQALEHAGIEARVQSTTRSPILIGADIRARIEVPDPYGEGIPNFLYNFSRDDYAAVLLLHETPVNAELQQLCARLGASAVSLATSNSAETAR